MSTNIEEEIIIKNEILPNDEKLLENNFLKVKTEKENNSSLSSNENKEITNFYKSEIISDTTNNTKENDENDENSENIKVKDEKQQNDIFIKSEICDDNTGSTSQIEETSVIANQIITDKNQDLMQNTEANLNNLVIKKEVFENNTELSQREGTAVIDNQNSRDSNQESLQDTEANINGLVIKHEVRDDNTQTEETSAILETNNQNSSDSNQASASASRLRDQCKYGDQCYRINPEHKTRFSHPGDADYDLPDNRPECKYGIHCYRKNPQHKKDYKHTIKKRKRTQLSAQAPDDLEDSSDEESRDESEYEPSFIDDESEYELSDENFDD